ncbi:MAG: hypothetical protein ACRD1E_11260, partial [Terriglobales bacterium]
IERPATERPQTSVESRPTQSRPVEARPARGGAAPSAHAGDPKWHRFGESGGTNAKPGNSKGANKDAKKARGGGGNQR